MNDLWMEDWKKEWAEKLNHIDQQLALMQIPATQEEILTEITRLSFHYRIGNHLTDAMLASVMDDYLEDLKSYPIRYLKKACKAWRSDATKQFFPQSGELIGLIDKELGEIRRLKKNIEWIKFKAEVTAI